MNMIENSNLILFVAATLVLLLTPGPAVVYIVTRSIDQGRKAGLVSTLGLAAGNLFHLGAAAMGLSALLLSSSLAFSAVKYLGAAYLIYLGIRKLIRPDESEMEVDGTRNLAKIFRQGILVNLLNPKPALFFFAFLPQFVETSKGAIALQIITLGLIFIGLGIVTDGLYAVLSGAIGRWIKRNPRFIGSGRYFAGGVYLALGIGTAISGSGRSKGRLEACDP